MKERAFELAQTWANDDYIDQADREHLQELLRDPAKNESEIVESFYQDLEFGTGGLRSILGVGSNRMNKYNVRKAAQAMVDALRAELPNGGRACVSFDCRNFSKEFSREVAGVFAANGLETFIFEDLAPTPMLSYAVRYYEANLGVMITASHNPKQYNGFKAYWADGAQVTPPNDQLVIDKYNAISNWNDIKLGSFEELMEKNNIKWVSQECIQSFYQTVYDNALDREMCLTHGKKVHIIYTPLHGTGYVPSLHVSKEMGFENFEIVESQAVFDGNFSTIKTTPNPEDPQALELAVAIMLEENADVAYGTDPDGDRLGVVVNNKGIPAYLNGNQIAILMMHYMLEQKSKQGTLPKKPLILKSLVTSPLQTTIATKYNTEVRDTLTGFKWMAKLWKELENTDYEYVFASEESFGYMPHDKVRDKDAVASIALMNEIVLYYKLQDMNLINALDKIYEEFGYAEESLVALTFEGLEGKEKINRIMQYYRDNSTADIAGFKVETFNDYKAGVSKNLASGETTQLDMTPSNVLGFTFTDGTKLFLRPSGTEPKIKFYTMVQVKDGDLTQKKQTAKDYIQKIEAEINERAASL